MMVDGKAENRFSSFYFELSSFFESRLSQVDLSFHQLKYAGRGI